MFVAFGRRDVCNCFGCGMRSVADAVDQLRAKGFVIKVSTMGGTKMYFAHPPSCPIEASRKSAAPGGRCTIHTRRSRGTSRAQGRVRDEPAAAGDQPAVAGEPEARSAEDHPIERPPRPSRRPQGHHGSCRKTLSPGNGSKGSSAPAKRRSAASQRRQVPRVLPTELSGVERQFFDYWYALMRQYTPHLDPAPNSMEGLHPGCVRVLIDDNGLFRAKILARRLFAHRDEAAERFGLKIEAGRVRVAWIAENAGRIRLIEWLCRMPDPGHPPGYV